MQKFLIHQNINFKNKLNLLIQIKNIKLLLIFYKSMNPNNKNQNYNNNKLVKNQ